MPDAFWPAALAELAAVPAEAEWRPSPEESTQDVAVYDVRFRGLGGARVAAWYAVPRRQQELPGLLLAPGYLADPIVPVEWAERGYAALSLAYRGKHRANLDVGPGFPGYVLAGIERPEDYIYRGVYTDAVRALELLRSRPEVDAGRVGVRGVSQGAAIVLAAAALSPGTVNAVAVGCPFLTDIDNALAEATSGPYEEIRALEDSSPHLREQIRVSLRHVDVVGLAGLIDAPVYLHIGGQDPTCPPKTAHTLAAALPGVVTVDEYADCGHEAGAFWANDKAAGFLADHLGPQPPAPISDEERARYFARIDEELSTLPRNASREPLPNSGDYDAWRVLFTGTDGVSLSALLTVPHNSSGRALFLTPRYGSVNVTPDRSTCEEFVTLTVNHRGQDLRRGSTSMPYPGVFRSAVLGPERFAYRHILSDTLCAVDVVLTSPELEKLTWAAVGDDLAILVAARRQVFAAARIDRLLFASAHGPGAEWRTAADSGDCARTLAVFDIASAARHVKVPVLACLSREERNVFPSHGFPDLTILELAHREAIDEPAQRQWLRDVMPLPRCS